MEANERELKPLLAEGETLTVEFKSDAKGLPDRDLVAAVVAMANTEVGLIPKGKGKGTVYERRS
jgi:ATP-dependent DNA helicase RecG